ncbi:MAG: DUF3570 domain-containing protein [Bacteroidia bacterium]|nr:DUF3570 domain-containing protein [Bacteroidia bacterium]
MRLQLILILVFGLGGNAIFAQTPADSLIPPRPVDINFLFNYYEQDGEHAAVTGGIGTQELKDQDGKIMVFVPLDSISGLHVTTGLNHYTSASTDAIDSRVSSASRDDNRAHIKFEYEKSNLQKRTTWSILGGASLESDYISTSIGYSWTRISRDGNREFSLQSTLYLDTWIVIFPEELRSPGLAQVNTDKRRSLNLTANLSQVINPRLQGSLSAGVTVQQGLLSTPFHRVYFQGSSTPRIEKLPGWNVKFPLGMRLNYFLGKNVVIRFFQRAYWDSFGVLASTSSLEIPVIVQPWLTLAPQYRVHVQKASDFFRPYAEHLPTDKYYTSDYDLSALLTQQYGLGLRINPLAGLLRFKTGGRRRQTFLVKSLELKWVNYQRSDGLKAVIFSGDLGFRIR